MKNPQAFVYFWMIDVYFWMIDVLLIMMLFYSVRLADKSTVCINRNAQLIPNFLWPPGGRGPKIHMFDYDMTPQGSHDLDPGSQGKPMNPWCVSFETDSTQRKKWYPFFKGALFFFLNNHVCGKKSTPSRQGHYS